MKKLLFLDGAMGTMLQKYGLPTGVCPESFNLTHPDIVQKIHREYAEAGSDILITNTFGANPLKLAAYGLEDKVEEICCTAVANARIGAGRPILVAGDMGPTGHFIAPLGNSSFEEIYDSYFTLASALAKGGADYLIIETIIDVQEMRAALLAAKDACTLPVICQFSFNEDGRTITGTTPEAAAILLDAMGADVIGVNCSLGPVQLLPIIKQMAAVTDKPLVIQANAGMPELVDGETVFPLSPQDMAAHVPDMILAGASYIGGCCGTSPAHIKAMKESSKNISLPDRQPITPFTAVTSRTDTVYLGKDFPPVMIGERINPTGRKILRADIESGKFIQVKQDALAQIDAGAAILDVNMGVPGLDQAPAMKKAITELSMICRVPLAIDTTDAAALEAGLKAYPGRALVNSVNADPDQLKTILPLVKRYGAAVLCLPIGSDGIPATAEERVAVIRTIVEAAKKAGLQERDLLLDPLVLTVASQQDNGKETLRTLQLYRKEFGYPTVMGLSNASFGLPNRPLLNSAFLAMALASGIDAPIVNPLNEEIARMFTAAKLLLGHDENAAAYIAANTQNEAASQPSAPAQETDPVKAIYAAVLHGEKEAVTELVKTALAQGISPIVITKEGLSAAMTAIGDDYGKGKCYLPQVMLAAETMQQAFSHLKEVLPAELNESRHKLAIATVKGDVHDLGKNIVSALWENNGFSVLDLGKDVSPETIVEEVQNHHIQLIGLCSLMTTTLPYVDETIQKLRQAVPEIKIMVGGAVVTQDYADAAGADGYAHDGIAAVKKAKELLGETK